MADARIRSRITVITMALAVCGAAFVMLAGAASAHVTVTAPGATSGGGDQEITFRVPAEKESNTIGLKIQLPTDTPIASVDVEPVAGWTHNETSIKLAKPIVTDDGDITEAVSEIDWTARAGQGLVPGEFGAFTIIAGQLPDVSSLTFKAIQLYSDGSQVDWTQTEAPGSNANLDNPAPVLTLAAAPATNSSAPAGSSGATSTPQASAPAKSTSNTGPIVLGIVALVVALLALGLAIVTRARTSGQHPS